MVASAAELTCRTLAGRVDPIRALEAIADRARPVMVPFAGHLVLAADPVEVVEGAEVWKALRVSCTHRSSGPEAAAGAWIGHLAYELAGTIERLPEPLPDPGGPPLATVGRYETVAIVDPQGGCVLASRAGGRALDDLQDALDRQVAGHAPRPSAPPTPIATPPVSSLPEARYLASVDRIRELIRAGDCYQVNLTQRLVAPWADTALDFAQRLWAAAGPTSHRAYLGLPEGVLVSASPERLVVVADRVATAEPIKGTAPLGRWHDLHRSVKDRAEHVMIVDLLRNDLGRVARAGGVSVPRLFAHLPTPYVEHMVSEIRAELRDGVTATDVLRAVFPSGSVTGTPKVRAMEVIRELEPVSRGPAFGSVVCVGTDGAIESSVAIRTAWVSGGAVRYWCGGAVVWDSGAETEYAEAYAKAAPFLSAIGRA